jgi:hydroxyacylglutathione hydrolase
MYFKPYYLGCLAHASYLIGGTDGNAAVIDPRRDVDEYIADAEAAGLTITSVIETHLHADFVSGHVELARRVGATIYLSDRVEGAGFLHHAAREGDIIAFGDVVLTFLETPGHTPESMTIVASVDGAPRLAFSGDTLFIGDVGRPDLAGSKGYTPEKMASMLFDSLRGKILPLPDDIEIWPAHGAGSSCGKSLSDEHVSPLGRQKVENIALRFVVANDRAGFITYATAGLGTAPTYFGHDVQENREGGRSVADILSAARRLTPTELEEMHEEGDVIVLDTRSAADFGAGHVPGAVHVQLEGKFAPWVGAVLPVDGRFAVVTAPGSETETVIRLARVGYDTVIGWLEGGMDAWIRAGGEIATVGQIAPAELRGERNGPDAPAVLDVRTDSEWEAGHIEGSVHIPLPKLMSNLNALPDRPFVILCGSGYRSSIAASLLQRAGKGDRLIGHIVGGWAAWSEAGL